MVNIDLLLKLDVSEPPLGRFAVALTHDGVPNFSCFGYIF